MQKSLKSASLNSMGSSNGSFSSGQDPSNLSMSQSVQNQLVQVKELEEEVSRYHHTKHNLQNIQEFLNAVNQIFGNIIVIDFLCYVGSSS